MTLRNSSLLAKARQYAKSGFLYVFSSFWHAIEFIAVTIIFGGVIMEVFSGAYTIEFNEVPETLGKRGLGKVALAVRVRDRVAAMVAQAQADVRLHAAVLETTTPDLKIVGTEIPLRYVANEIRNFFGIPLLRISGLIFENDANPAIQQSSTDSRILENTNQNLATFRLVLHSNVGNDSPIFEISGSLGAVIDAAALETLRAIDPITAAGFLRNGSNEEKIRALHIVYKAIKNSEEIEKSAWFRLDGNRLNLLPRALLMKAYVFTAMQNDADAITAFDEVGNEYRRRQLPLGQAYALDGKAFVLIQRATRSFSEEIAPKKDAHQSILAGSIPWRKLSRAGLYLDQALNLVPNYDSALFHKAEILGEIAKHQIKNRDCKAAKTIADARLAFDKVTKYRPNFAVAYSGHATLLSQWLNFLLFDADAAACVDQRSAPWRVPGLPASVIDTLEEQADEWHCHIVERRTREFCVPNIFKRPRLPRATCS